VKIFQRFTVVSVFLLATAAQAPEVLADDSAESSDNFNFVTSVGVQNKLLTFNQKYDGPAAADKSYADFAVNLPIGNLSFTASLDKVFLALKYEKSLTESSTGVDETNREALFGDANLLTIDGSQLGVTREDMSLTFGYNVFSSLNIFIGYMRGETALTPDPFLNHNTFFLNKAYLTEDERFNGRNVPRYEQTYVEAGPYIGLSYAWKIADAGTLSASAAYADLNGVYKDNADCLINTCTRFDWEGKSKGTSLGLTWTAPLGENSSYFLDLRRQAYKMDGKDQTGLFTGQSVTTDETMQGLTAGVQFYF
jgi:hypothetical protein